MIIFRTRYAVKTAISHHIAINTEADNVMFGGCVCKGVIPLQRADRYSAIDDSKSLLEVKNLAFIFLFYFW